MDIPRIRQPNQFIYEYLQCVSGPQSALGTDYDMDTDSDAVASVFEFTVPTEMILSRFCIELMDTQCPAQNFGNIGALTNGCLFQILDVGGGVQLDFTRLAPIVRNADFAVLAGVDVSVNADPGEDLLAVRFTVSKAGAFMRLKRNWVIRWTNRDDVSGVTIFRIMVQGIHSK